MCEPIGLVDASPIPGPRTLVSVPQSENKAALTLPQLRRPPALRDSSCLCGFRALARTRLDVIEHQLAHAVRDPLGRA
jgi:hypothetical protein